MTSLQIAEGAGMYEAPKGEHIEYLCRADITDLIQAAIDRYNNTSYVKEDTMHLAKLIRSLAQELVGMEEENVQVRKPANLSVRWRDGRNMISWSKPRVWQGRIKPKG